MALLKNLYLDLSFMNPFRNIRKKNVKAAENTSVDSYAPVSKPMFVQSSQVIKTEAKDLPQVSKNIILSEEKKLVLPKVVRKQVEQPPRIQETKQGIKNQTTYSSENLKLSQNSYFSNMSSKDLLNSDALRGMQSFWQEQKSRVANMNLNKQMNEELQKKFDDLQKLEVEWQRMQLEYDRLSDELSSKELHIENHIKDIKKRFKGMHFHAHTQDHHNFILSNGTRLKSLNELVQALPLMDESVYDSHVNTQKNDFANWVKDVMNLSDLAQKMYSIKEKQELIETIQTWKNSH